MKLLSLEVLEFGWFLGDAAFALEGFGWFLGGGAFALEGFGWFAFKR